MRKMCMCTYVHHNVHMQRMQKPKGEDSPYAYVHMDMCVLRRSKTERGEYAAVSAARPWCRLLGRGITLGWIPLW